MARRSVLNPSFSLFAVALAACGGDGGAQPGAPDAPVQVDAPAGGAQVLKRPSKSSTVAVSDDDKRVVMVNPQDDSISVFQTSDLARTAKMTTGKEPSAVVLSPDGKTAYVANRAGATVVKVVGIDTASPTIAGTLDTGSEPTGVALSPTGARLFVAELAEGSVLVADTASMQQTGLVKGAIKHPFALAVTNNGDPNDDDELLIVPEFFGEPNEFANDATTLDKSRTGRVRIYDLATLSPQQSIALAPRDTKIVPQGTDTSVFASPNQLGAAFVRRAGGKNLLYLPSVAAAPQGVTRFDGNIYPIVYVADLDARAEVVDAGGTANLSEKIRAAGGSNFLAEIVDLSFVPGADGDGNVAYVVSRGGDAVQRVTYTGNDVTIGGSVNLTVDVIGDAKDVHAGCKGPTGIVVSNDGAKAYLNCWVSQRLGVVELGNTQALTATAEAFPQVQANQQIDRGRRFYFTGRGRWSGNGSDNADLTVGKVDAAWNSCGGCHPGGLTDNVTWIFAAGPRQATSMDGTFSHGGGPQRQRLLNWTAIFDEIHDFEHNTRQTAGGLGAMTNGDCTSLAGETRQPLPGNLVDSAKAVQDNPGNCRHDWDDIEAWVKTIRPPRGLRRLDAAAVAEGAQLFAGGSGVANGNCVACHGGDGWTISRRFYTPSHEVNSALLTAVFSGNAPWPILWNTHTTQIQNEQPMNIAPPEVACVIRNLATASFPSTFGPDALEKKPDGKGGLVTAEGQGGYNVPSLYGLSLGAPYLHSGLAPTLRALLDDYPGHLHAGNDNFDPSSEQKDALVAYLLSIDADTPEQGVPDGFDKCVAVQ